MKSDYDWAVRYVNKLHKKTHRPLYLLKKIAASDLKIQKRLKKAIAKLEKDDLFCSSCAAAKSHKVHPKGNITGENSTALGWTADTATNLPRSRQGNTLFFLAKEGNGWMELGYSSAKSDAAPWVEDNAPRWAEDSSLGFKNFRTDNGEFCTNSFEKWCKANGVRHTKTPPNDSHGNAEQGIRVIKESAKAFLNGAFNENGLVLEDESKGGYLWDEAVAYSRTVHLMMPSSIPHLKGLSPWEYRKGSPPPRHKLHTWGSLCYVNKPNARTFANPGRPAAFMGFANDEGKGDSSKGFRFYDRQTNTIFHSSSFTCMENVSYFSIDLKVLTLPQPKSDCFNPACHAKSGKHHKDCPYFNIMMEEEEQPLQEGEQEEETSEPRKREQRQVFDPQAFDAAWEHDHEAVYSAIDVDAIYKECPLWEEDIDQAFIVNQHVTGDKRYTAKGRLKSGLIPKDEAEALRSEDRKLWKAAIQKEKNALEKMNTFAEVPRSEALHHAPLLKARFVFAIKYYVTGEIEKHKARLVGLGYLQRLKYGTETYAPTPSLVVIRMIIVMALQYGWEFSQFDMTSAFLNASTGDRKIYMEPPKSFDVNSSRVYRLRKYLYGLKESSLQWFKELNSKLVAKDFISIKSDPCVTVHRDSKNTIDGVTVCHVDDGFVTAPKPKKGKIGLIAKLYKHLRSYYTVNTVDGAKSAYVGIKVEFSKDGQRAEMSQTAPIDNLLNEFGMADCNPSRLPARTKPLKYGPLTKDEIKFMADKKDRFHTLTGSLQYLQRCTRPDIAEITSRLAGVVNEPRKNDWDAAMKVLKYLKGTRTYGLRYIKNPDGILHPSVGFSDANHGGWSEEYHPNSKRRSQSGAAFLMNMAAVDWGSVKQTCTARNSAESELVALDFSAKKGLNIRHLEKDLGIATGDPTSLREDNDAAIAISARGRRTKRTKHIDISYFAITQDVEEGRFTIDPVSTDENVADIFTKPLGHIKFEKFRAALGVVDLTIT